MPTSCLHLEDEEILPLVQKDLATCIPGFADANIVDHSVIRLPQAVSHFAPGSYRYLLSCRNPFAQSLYERRLDCESPRLLVPRKGLCHRTRGGKSSD
jgi:hypothetical protein